MKILTVCQGGNSRSVACAYLLKYEYSIDALAIGWEKNSVDTLSMLCTWADKVIIMQAEFEQFIPTAYKEKIEIIDVGPDVWFNGLHPELINIIGPKLDLLLEKIR